MSDRTQRATLSCPVCKAFTIHDWVGHRRNNGSAEPSNLRHGDSIAPSGYEIVYACSQCHSRRVWGLEAVENHVRCGCPVVPGSGKGVSRRAVW